MARVLGLHHVTLLTANAVAADRFMRTQLGLARVKQTVNADRPDSYHLFYGDAAGRPGTLVTVAAFANLPTGLPGVGEIAEPVFTVAPGALTEWHPLFHQSGYTVHGKQRSFDRNRLFVEGPDSERVVLQVDPQDARPPRSVPFGGRAGIRGLHSILLRVRDAADADRLLAALGYTVHAQDGDVTRYAVERVEGGRFVDVVATPNGPNAQLGAGSVHHAAFTAADDEALFALEDAIRNAGFETTQIADRRYFRSFFFRGPDGLLLEVATDGPGFAVDEDEGALGNRLVLLEEHERDRSRIEANLEPLDA